MKIIEDNSKPKFEIGDMVREKADCEGSYYDQYTGWADIYGLTNFAFNQKPEGGPWRVIKVGPHSACPGSLYLLGVENDEGKQYIFDQSAMEKCEEDLKVDGIFRKPTEKPEYLDPGRMIVSSSPTYQYTFSGQIEFPNGDKVVIPNPDNTWKADGGRSCHYRPKFIANISESSRGFAIIMEVRGMSEIFSVYHKEGMIIIKEYLKRINAETARINWYKTWVREV